MELLASASARIVWIIFYPLRLLWRVFLFLFQSIMHKVVIPAYEATKAKLEQFLRPLYAPMRRMARKIGRFTIQVIKYTAVLVCYVSSALFFATVIYLLLYYSFIPYIAVQKPLYFDYSSSPQADVRLLPRDKFSFSYSHPYDFRVDLELPESRNNIDAGMFMISITLFSEDDQPLHTSSRPAILQFKTSLLRQMYTVFWALPLVLGFMHEKQTISVVPIEGWVANWEKPFAYARVTLSKPEIQLYSAYIHIEAKLTGLSYFAYYWFFTSFFVFVSIIFCIETFFTIIFGLILWHLISRGNVQITVTREREKVKRKKKKSRMYRKGGTSSAAERSDEGSYSESTFNEAESEEEPFKASQRQKKRRNRQRSGRRKKASSVEELSTVRESEVVEPGDEKEEHKKGRRLYIEEEEEVKEEETLAAEEEEGEEGEIEVIQEIEEEEEIMPDHQPKDELAKKVD